MSTIETLLFEAKEAQDLAAAKKREAETLLEEAGCREIADEGLCLWIHPDYSMLDDAYLWNKIRNLPSNKYIYIRH